MRSCAHRPKTARRRDLLEVEGSRDGFIPSYKHIAVKIYTGSTHTHTDKYIHKEDIHSDDIHKKK